MQMNLKSLCRIFLAASLFLSFVPDLKSQSDYHFENYGKQLFTQLTDTAATQDPEFIRIRVYRQLIDKQDFSHARKSAMKTEMEGFYEDRYIAYIKSVRNIKSDYHKDAQSGAEYQYLSTSYEPAKGKMGDVFNVNTRFLYKSDEVQNLVSFKYQVAYLDNYLVLFSAIEEEF